MYVVRFSGFTVKPSMLRVSPSSLCCRAQESTLKFTASKITAKRSVSRKNSEHYQLFQCIS